MSAIHKMGGDSVITNTLGILFTDGTEQFTAAVPASPVVQAGSAPFGGTSQSIVTFPTPFVATAQPVVVVSPQGGLLPFPAVDSVAVNGSAGHWTGFTLTLSGNCTGGWNYVAVGKPN